MLVDRIGEFGLIQRIKKSIKTDNTVITGIGDDCAVLKYDKNKYLLFTCDMLVEAVDFRLRDKPYLVGRKALAASISDIAACGGVPKHALIALGIPKRASVKLLDGIYKGIVSLARTHKINIVGGDISRALALSISVTILGEVEKKNLVLRSGAKIGDFIFVSAALGGSIYGKHLKFSPRLEEARFLVKNFNVHAMIDISDGLAQDLGHVLKESNVGALIYEELIPLAAKARNLEDALYMGEDFELLFTLPRKQAGRLLNLKKKKNFRMIGEIVEKKEGLKLVDKRGRIKIIKPEGFRHF